MVEAAESVGVRVGVRMRKNKNTKKHNGRETEGKNDKTNTKTFANSLMNVTNKRRRYIWTPICTTCYKCS